jgi:ABC-2 type transport system ATP-binding protein
MKKEILKINSLNKNFKNNHVLKDITFELNSGEILAIIGPNGSGKTTLMKILSGYLQQTSGEIVLAKNNEISVSFGGQSGFYPNLNAKDNLKFFAALELLNPKEINTAVENALNIVKLNNLEMVNFGQYSLGMKQRLHIARALIKNPDILLLDEPTNGIDVEIAREIREHIKNIANNGKGVIITSHILSEIEKIADRIILLNKGEIYYEGPIEGIFETARQYTDNELTTLEEAYLAIYDELGENE